MLQRTHVGPSAVLLFSMCCGLATAQQPVAPQGNALKPNAVQPSVQVPAGFQLNQLQEAYLERVLDAWETNSGQIKTFRCAFDRWEYNAAFGPGGNLPLNKDKGELSYEKPDKGSFQITEIKRWQAAPAPSGGQQPTQVQGDWVKQQNAIGEHWVCDGKAVYEYRHDQKQLVERPIPPNMQGQAIVDGPLPFLFGAEARKLKERYWMRVEEQPNQDEIWLQALPRFQADAANFRAVEVILDRQQLLPKAMNLHLPDGSRHVYMFHLADATINDNLNWLKQLFQRPRTPYGWKRVVEEAPVQQAAQPAAQQR